MSISKYVCFKCMRTEHLLGRGSDDGCSKCGTKLIMFSYRIRPPKDLAKRKWKEFFNFVCSNLYYFDEMNEIYGEKFVKNLLTSRTIKKINTLKEELNKSIMKGRYGNY